MSGAAWSAVGARAPRDRALETRFAIALGLVVCGYVVVVGIAFAIAWWLGAILVALAVVSALLSGRGAIAVTHAYEVSEQEEPVLHEILADLARRAGCRPPRLMLIDSDQPNAFAIGLGQSGTICVTRGMLAYLQPPELRAVLAHELSHLVNRDAPLMGAAWFLPMLSGAIAALGAAIGDTGRGGGIIGFLLVAVGFVVMAFGLLLLALALVVVSGLSRAREYAADRYSAQLLGSPRPLGTALEVLAAVQGVPDRRLGIFAGYLFLGGGGVLRGLVSTHPDPWRRISRLRRMEMDEGDPALASPAARPRRLPGTILLAGALGGGLLGAGILAVLLAAFG